MKIAGDLKTAGQSEAGGDRSAAVWLRRGVASVVVAVAVTALFRLPSCAESFWLDELHSAWTVDGDFQSVGPRAAIGNQTTGYFHLLWGWKQMVRSAGQGQLEVAFRSLGVLLNCLAAGALVAGVTWRTGRAAAGVLAGLVFAVDSNAVFFGCELRPYSMVLLCSTLASFSMMLWLGKAGQSDSKSRSRDERTPIQDDHQGIAPASSWTSRRGTRWRLSMLFWICVAALIHPTSLGVLGWLIPLALLAAWRRGLLRLGVADAVAGALILITLVLLANSSLASSWERRDLWRAFGLTRGWWQLRSTWPWVPLLVMPCGIAVLLSALDRLILRSENRGDRASSGDWIGLIPAAAALLGTVTFFLLAHYQWVPLWHRRYYIAAFPLLAWTTGECGAISMTAVAAWSDRLSQWKPGGSISKAASAVTSLAPFLIAGVILISLCVHQGSLAVLMSGRIPRQFRGERWREAVALVDEERSEGDAIWLDSGLIEAAFLRHPMADSPEVTARQWEYLSFPLRGPYRLDPVLVVSCGEDVSWLDSHIESLPESGVTVWLVARASSDAARQFVSRLGERRDVEATEMQPGNPLVLRLEFAPH